MGREKDSKEEGRKIAASAVVEMRDVDGNLVRVPMINNQDWSVPQPDSDGTVPEFANISGTVQQMVIPNNPNATISVEPWGVLKGSQWRSFSEPAPAWGNTPRFLERKRNANGNFDPVYLLTEDQAVGEIKRLNNPDPGFTAYKRLDGYEANGKIHKYDAANRMLPGDYSEDRGAILATLAKQVSQLRKGWDREKENRGMSATD